MNSYAYRSVDASIKNDSASDLTFQKVEMAWGKWFGEDLSPESVPENIKTIPKGQTRPFKVESDRWMTGCEGSLVYTLADGTTFTVYWNNPFINCAWESNEYTQKRSDGPLENADNDDEKGDEESVCRFVCRAKGVSADAGVRPPIPGEQSCTVEPGKEGHLSACPSRVNVIIVPGMPAARPGVDDKWYWFLMKWGEQWVANAPSDEKRDIVYMPIKTLSGDKKADLVMLRQTTLNAYKQAIDKQKGGGGEVIHAVGHGTTIDVANLPHLLGAFDLSAQKGKPETHLLFASSLTFAVGERNATIVRGEEVDEEATQTERDNYKLLQDIAAEFRRGGRDATSRIVTCLIAASPVFHQELANLWDTSVTAYNAVVFIADASGGAFDIGFLGTPEKKGIEWNWEENFHKELPNRSTHERYASRSTALELEERSKQ